MKRRTIVFYNDTKTYLKMKIQLPVDVLSIERPAHGQTVLMKSDRNTTHLSQKKKF
jgi:hypothetical protein